MKPLAFFQSLFLVAVFSILGFTTRKEQALGQTEITKWQGDKPGALTITYDDGYLKQFSVAIPLMNQYKLPSTFFIITSQIAGSQNKARFIGRPVQQIIAETVVMPTNKENFFERASAVPYLGFRGINNFHTDAGNLYVSGKIPQAYQLIDSVYKRVRNGEFQPSTAANPANPAAAPKGLTWDDVRRFESQGHEFGSHTITHPMTPVLDEPNLLYELEKSKEDLQRELGAKGTFSAECSYGIEDERVMSYALKIYPALRNRMPEPWLTELNRGSKKFPGSFNTEYVQWQRGLTTKTNMPLMKSWVDTTLTHTNNWLVLVIHGVDGNGYEAMTHEQLDEYFRYIKERENKLWVATFADVTKYMRERMAAKVQTSQKGNMITVKVGHSLDKAMYNVPLTLKSYVSPSWKQAKVLQSGKVQLVSALRDSKGTYILYQINPDNTPIQINKA